MREDHSAFAETAQRVLPYVALATTVTLVVSGGSLCCGLSVAGLGFGAMVLYARNKKAKAELERHRRLAAPPPDDVPADRRDAARQPTRWPLESPYRLTVVGLAAPGERADPGQRTAAVVRFQDTRIVLVPSGSDAAWEPPAVILYDGIERVELTAASAVLVCAGGAYALVPASFADRERLEWELAVRLPDAMERGLGGPPQ